MFTPHKLQIKNLIKAYHIFNKILHIKINRTAEIKSYSHTKHETIYHKTKSSSLITLQNE